MFGAHRLQVVFSLRSGEQVCGFAALGPRPGGQTYGADLELGAGMVAQAVVAFDNCWHLREMIDKKQYEKELAVAAGIQQRLFPSCCRGSPASTWRRSTVRRTRSAATTTTC